MKIITNTEKTLARWEADGYAPTEAETRLDAGHSPEIIDAIKAEAQRRIIELTGGGQYYAAKQQNMTARFSEILDARMINGSLTAQEQAEYNALTAFWAKDLREGWPA